MGASHPLLLLMLAAVLLMVMIVEDKRAQAEGVGRPPPGCKRTCGSMELPYPFGINDDAAGKGCFLPGFNLTCNYSYSPPKLVRGDFEITGLNISSGQMTVLAPISYNCYDNSSGIPNQRKEWRVTLSSINRVSNTENVFTAVGCETSARFKFGNKSFGGCISGCDSNDNATDGNCSGVGCCQTSIPHNSRWYETSYYNRSNGTETYKFNPCSYSFIVQKSKYTFRRSDLAFMDEKRMFPMVLDWAIREKELNCEEAKKNTTSYACVSDHSECFNSPNGPGYICNCYKGYQDNPYLLDGCTDIDECSNADIYPCKGKCENIAGGYNCYCDDGFFYDNSTQRCIRSNGKLPLSMKLVIGIGCGLAFLFITCLICCLGFQRRKLIKLREKFFERNGGAFLQQALSSNGRSTFKIFSTAELKKATNNFDEGQILGQGGFGTVYRGKLEDGRIVAIKRSMVVDEKNGREFANELFILSEINHKNIVKLLGCCLDHEVPMLVYEFISKGTLFDYIHKGDQQPIPFSTRLRIATEAAEALKYLHTDASPPILHGDVKSSNVLIDEKDVAKVSDFGTSTLAPKDMAQFTTFIQGTCGYLDPEYLINGCLTDRSDVFSFGVILVEFLTRRKPFNFEASTEMERSLALNFISCANNNRLEEILDPEIMQEGMSNKVLKVAEIALQCLNVRGEDRPTMKEVAIQLEYIEGIQRHPWISYNPDEVEHLLGDVAGGSSQVTGTMNQGIFDIEGGR